MLAKGAPGLFEKTQRHTTYRGGRKFIQKTDLVIRVYVTRGCHMYHDFYPSFIIHLEYSPWNMHRVGAMSWVSIIGPGEFMFIFFGIVSQTLGRSQMNSPWRLPQNWPVPNYIKTWQSGNRAHNSWGVLYASKFCWVHAMSNRLC